MKVNVPSKILIWLLFAVIAVGLSIVGVFVSVYAYYNIITLEYSSTSTIYILSDNNVVNADDLTQQNTLYQELMSGTEIARDFTNFISTEAGLVQLRRNLGESVPWLLTHQFDPDKHFIIATHAPQSRVVIIEVLCDNPYDAATISNACIDILNELSVDLYRQNYVQVVQVAAPETIASSPERKVVVPIGFGSGLVLGVLIDFLIWRQWQKRRLEKYAPVIQRVVDRRRGKGNWSNPFSGQRGSNQNTGQENTIENGVVDEAISDQYMSNLSPENNDYPPAPHE